MAIVYDVIANLQRTVSNFSAVFFIKAKRFCK